MSGHPLIELLATRMVPVSRHSLLIAIENEGARARCLDRLRSLISTHYISPAAMKARLARFGAPATARLLRGQVPSSKQARSGDLGEIFATEFAELHLGFSVPIRRLRWKDGRNTALRGDDLVGVVFNGKTVARLLKGEAKSRGSLATVDLTEAAAALDRDRGRPSRHSVLFVSARLRAEGKRSEVPLADALDGAVLQSFRGVSIEHLLFVLTGSNPEPLLTTHLQRCARAPKRNGTGIRIEDHGAFIEQVYKGL